jgi:tetratricopeptide (TPR) repeat protein
VALAGVSLAYFAGGSSAVVDRAPAATMTPRPAPSAAMPVSGTAGTALAPDPVVTAFDDRRAGAVAYGSGNIDSARQRYQDAVEANPNDPDALNDLGQLLVRSNRAPEAIRYFDRAIQLSATTWAYRFNRARAYAEMQEWPRAVADYREAARLFPDDYATEFNLARALQADGDLSGAIAGFERAITLAPGQADFHLSHGLALEAARRTKDAIAAYRRYLELDPAGAEADKVKAHITQLEGLESGP